MKNKDNLNNKMTLNDIYKNKSLNKSKERKMRKHTIKNQLKFNHKKYKKV